MIIDTHSHLFAEDFDNDLEECINRAIANNVEKIITVGFSHVTNIKAYNLRIKNNIFYNTAGIHPSEVESDIIKNISIFEEFIKNHKVFALGEMGLDYYHEPYDKELQKQYFIKQIELSIKYDLPIIVHMRDATKDTFDILALYSGKVRGVMHCYSGSYEVAVELIKLGFYISLAGPVTFKNNVEGKKIAKNIDINKLLVETDSPYLAPSPYRGKRNESSYITNILKEISEIRNIEYDELVGITTNNALKLFKI